MRARQRGADPGAAAGLRVPPRQYQGGGPDDDGLVSGHVLRRMASDRRLIASTRESGRLSAIVRAAAGIGRTALARPWSFVSTVGLREVS